MAVIEYKVSVKRFDSWKFSTPSFMLSWAFSTIKDIILSILFIQDITSTKNRSVLKTGVYKFEKDYSKK